MLSPMIFRNVITTAAVARRSQLFFRTLTISSCNLIFRTRSSRLTNTADSLKLLFKPKGSQKTLVRCKETYSFNVNTNVQNNVLLYKNENYSYYQKIMLFGVLQSVMWTCIGYFSYTPQFWTGWFEEKTAKDYFRKYSLYLVLFLTPLIAAPGIFMSGWLLTVRSVKYLILNKGGKTITVMTHHPLRWNNGITVPVENIKTTVVRGDKKQYTPLKVRGKSFHYMLERNGTYVNTALYEHVVESMKSW